jgi:hypothetical protein
MREIIVHCTTKINFNLRALLGLNELQRRQSLRPFRGGGGGGGGSFAIISGSSTIKEDPCCSPLLFVFVGLMLSPLAWLTVLSLRFSISPLLVELFGLLNSSKGVASGGTTPTNQVKNGERNHIRYNKTVFNFTSNDTD